jgi:hypothetical protein
MKKAAGDVLPDFRFGSSAACRDRQQSAKSSQSLSAQIKDQMDAPETNIACREVIDAWSNLAQLVDFAEQRHGFGNSNGGLGVIYPDDVDDYMAEVEGVHVPDGWVLLYGYAIAIPPGYEILVEESVYLSNLANVLRGHGLSAEAKRVTVLLKTLTHKSS